MKIAPRSRQRGVALLVVLAFVIILTVLASVFAINMQVEAKLARNADAGTEVEWLCRSGVEMAKYVLFIHAKDIKYDCLYQTWAGVPQTNEFNPLLNNLNLTDSTWGEGTLLGLLYPDEDPGEGYRCSVKIVDMERKFNINRAAERSMGRAPLEETFEMMGVDVSLISYLVDAIIDWRDDNDAVGVNGAESEYYEPLGYLAKNGPVDDLRELLLIKDITPEMYWGNATNSLVAGAVPTPVGEEGDSLNYNYALVDLFTPLSLGYVNINTAPAEVLQLVLSASPRLGDPAVTAQEIVRIREEVMLPEQAYENVAQLSQVQAYASNPEELANASRFFSVRSSTFEVKVTASVRGQERTLVAVLQRGRTNEIKILYTYWES